MNRRWIRNIIIFQTASAAGSRELSTNQPEEKQKLPMEDIVQEAQDGVQFRPQAGLLRLFCCEWRRAERQVSKGTFANMLGSVVSDKFGLWICCKKQS